MPLLRSRAAVLAMNTEKLGKLLKMLSSSSDGEVVAAARAIMRTLENEGGDIHELAARVADNKLLQADMQKIYDAAYRKGKDEAAATTGFNSVDPPSFYEMACEIQAKDDERGQLGEKERGFIDDMVRWTARREPTERQASWLHSIYCKVGRWR
jgi:hypothetical protein